ncbi:MAG: hypothetical protein ACK4ZJ_17750, partial [Allorhizobium sp.]
MGATATDRAAAAAAAAAAARPAADADDRTASDYGEGEAWDAADVGSWAGDTDDMHDFANEDEGAEAGEEEEVDENEEFEDGAATPTVEDSDAGYSGLEDEFDEESHADMMRAEEARLMLAAVRDLDAGSAFPSTDEAAHAAHEAGPALPSFASIA